MNHDALSLDSLVMKRRVPFTYTIKVIVSPLSQTIRVLICRFQGECLVIQKCYHDVGGQARRKSLFYGNEFITCKRWGYLVEGLGYCFYLVTQHKIGDLVDVWWTCGHETNDRIEYISMVKVLYGRVSFHTFILLSYFLVISSRFPSP